jgi:hypothetical protein
MDGPWEALMFGIKTEDPSLELINIWSITKMKTNTRNTLNPSEETEETEDIEKYKGIIDILLLYELINKYIAKYRIKIYTKNS